MQDAQLSCEFIVFFRFGVLTKNLIGTPQT